MSTTFPKDFDWGVATTAVQIEGGLGTDGRGPSMWPDFADQAGNIFHDDHPRGSAASYRFLERDLNAVRELGLSSYNFSPSWTRILPQGSGATNEAGLDYYDRLIDGLLERDVQPELSLFDWDLPRAYAEAGGWEQRDLVGHFADYVDVLLRRYGDRVTHWMTFNEISTQATNGYRSGNQAPGRQSDQGMLKAYHHLMLAHGRSVGQLRDYNADLSISVVDNLIQYYPKTVSAADRAATQRQLDVNTYYLLDCLFHGRLRPSFVEHFTENLGCNFNHVRTGDLGEISRKVDRFGVNYFTSFSVADDPNNPGMAEQLSASPGPQGTFGWTIDPDGLLDALRRLHQDYTKKLPLFIGECGIGLADYQRPDGTVNDRERISYLYEHLRRVGTAMEEGIPVKGFYVWTLMDNFEWQDGYRKRFGLYYTRYAQPDELVAKRSAKWFGELTRSGELRSPEQTQE